MNISIISDTHFEHKHIAEYCNRPEGWEDLIIHNLSRLETDVLIHLGDVSLGSDSLVHNFFKELPYKKWLVLGNHDSKSISWYLSHGWDFVARNFTMYLYGLRIMFSHRPSIIPPTKVIVKELARDVAHSEILVDKERSNFDINIHGHIHNREDLVLQKWQKPYIIEYQDYKPIDLKEFLHDEIKAKSTQPLQNGR